jgi:hypothetical protein
VAGQDEESGLEGVLGVLVVAQDVAADAPDERAVALHERGKGVLLLAVGEALEQLLVRQFAGARRDCQVANVPEDRAQGCGWHGVGSNG